LLLSLFLLSQAITQRSLLYGILFLAALTLFLRTLTLATGLTNFLFLFFVWIMIHMPSVQTWMIREASDRLSYSMHTRVSISHVDFSLFNRIILRDALLEDQQKDTLLYAGGLKVQITDLLFREKKISLRYIGLTDATIKLQRRDSVWNYQFLSDYFSSPTSGNSSGFELNLNQITLSNIHFVKRDLWRGEDFDVRLGDLQLNADSISLAQKTAIIKTLDIRKLDFAIYNYDGRRLISPPSDSIYNDQFHLRLNPADWKIRAADISIQNSSFRDYKIDGQAASRYFDGKHIYFYTVNGNFHQVLLHKDTVTAQVSLSTRERCGFEVKKLTASIKFFPEGMEFHKLDLQTAKSHIRNYYAMRFRTFDDMPDFISKITMEGNFTDSYVDSYDIGFFVPELKDWNRKIRLTGVIKGPVENLVGRKILLEAGNSTLLNGDIHLKGLPDIDHTYIEFRSNDFRTTYADATSLIPHLRDIHQPRIDRISSFRFTGSFVGYLKNFVADGTMETNLGTLVTDVNMKFPDHRPTIYSGKISTEKFDLGQLLDNSNLGSISFSGKVAGSGLLPKTVNATLDGSLKSIEFNKYTYRNIIVNGTIAKRKFNGELISKDSNLYARMNGLMDFSGHQPRFDLNAEIGRTDLRKLRLTHDSIELNGKLRLNFTGSNIDNFIGFARFYDAGIFKNGQRISFDSLDLESKVSEGNNKSISIESNEFDAAIAGEFNIQDLPDAFQTFLNKYYPAYIRPARRKPAENQNFSFVISTRKVDDYISFIDKKLGGFNNSTLSGRIDTRNNLLDLNAEVPQFNYSHFSFLNSKLKGKGTYDSLSVETNIGEVYVNDSLHFPNTHMLLRSSNDLSAVNITTSASQTLNAASVDAQIRTSQTGFHVRFNPSTFDVNGKKWTIQKDGEFEIENDIVAANSLKISSDDQQIQVTTHPSSSGSWNDLQLDLKKINIGDFTSYLVKSDRIEGLLSGSGTIKNPLRDGTDFSFKGLAEQFRLNNDSVGKLEISSGYEKETGLITAHVNSDNLNYHFDLQGIFKTSDSLAATTQPVNILTHFKDTKIDLLGRYVDTVFSNVQGFATGQLQIVGPANELKYIGDVSLRDARLRVKYTKCTYLIPKAQVALRDGYMDFGSFQIRDTLGNTGQVKRSKLMHHSFSDLAYDFAISTNKLLVLNTKGTDNNQFYGKVIGKAEMSLSGPDENMLLEIKGAPADSSELYLPLNSTRESADADFLIWKVYGKEMKRQTNNKETNLTVKLDLTANNFANVYVILDPLTGDIIKANGHGNLQMRVGSAEDLSISGRYEIDKGSYNFTFQSFIRKPFIFREGGDNYIQWKGDPYKAEINIEAIYQADNISFNDLAYTNSTVGKAFGNSAELTGYRGPILVIADLTQKLTQPHIEFKIELPQNSPLKNDMYATLLLNLIESDPNELNKQVSFLLVFNSFGPMSNTNTAFDPSSAVTGIFVSSISGFISNQLSQQFSSIFKKVFNNNNLRLNLNTNFYNGSAYLAGNVDQSKIVYDRTNVNLSVAKSFLDERLTFTFGSALDIGLSAQQAAASSFQFLPDLNMDYKITKDGKLTVSVFYRDSYNYLSAANRTANSSGTSLSYHRNFDRIDELFRKKKKDKPKETPPPVPPVTTSSGTQ
jgi:hypothetical protein